ncbi:hypothetical protein [Devosia sp. LjRoot3]|uniref:hypothetical protein n=1 Tax=Devosia sp. LjRoot3 TaxID=3342319 RepID=UPI003ECF2B56
MEQTGWISTISDVMEIVGAIATVVLAYVVYAYTKKREAFEATSQVQTEWQHANELALTNPEILSIEIAGHPHGELSEADARKMYWYFVKMNIAFNSWVGRLAYIDQATAQSTIDTVINSTFRDRDFIRTHVLPRGYSKTFAREIEAGWTKIDRSGQMIEMT